MSTNDADTESVSSSTASPSLSAIIHPSLTSLMLSHTFLLLLIPLFFSLFYFSLPQARRKPIFILNVIAIVLAFVVGVLCDGVSISFILDPLNPWPGTFDLSIGFIAIWQALVVDTTLLVRVTAVYPLAQLGRMHFSLLIAIPVLLKLVRITNLVIFTKVLVDDMNGPNAAVTVEGALSSTPCIKIEWAAQMIDNTYASVAFLWRLHIQESGQIVTGSRVTLAQRVRTLFNIALANFVIPAMFSIVQFVCVYRNVDTVILDQIMLMNMMLATFGVAFATVWAGCANREEARIPSLHSKHNNTMSSLTASSFQGTRVRREPVIDYDDPWFGSRGELWR